jgi:predicted nucleotidyltransferase
MQTKMSYQSIKQMLIANAPKLRSFGVTEIGVFGSYISGHQNLESDIDILVSLDKKNKTLRNFLSLAYYLEDLLQNRVDLVTKESLSKHISKHILDTVVYVPISE